ncbi:CMP-N-acetylneuraminate-beta-1,4-galactoside alpha-2,3-sialyltransferase-like [Branchiostoma floridae x Branchiostoma belcheri]
MRTMELSMRLFVFLLGAGVIMINIFYRHLSYKIHKKEGPSLQEYYRSLNYTDEVFLKRIGIRPPGPKFSHPIKYPEGDSCIPGYAKSLVTEINPKFNTNLPLFVKKGFREWRGLMDDGHDKLPFYLSDQDCKMVDQLLDLLPSSDHPVLAGGGKCLRCIVVGSSGLVSGQNLGSTIDKYDVVMRMNAAPVRGYEKDIGSKTTFRFIYPESATLKDVDSDADYVLVPYKTDDLAWLLAVIQKEKPEGTFWKEIGDTLNVDPSRIRVLNPQVARSTSYEHVGMMNVPTIGTIAVVAAFHFCDMVDIVGFGLRHDKPYHYFENKTIEGEFEGLFAYFTVIHDFAKEKEFIKDLVRRAAINDLTHGYEYE